MKDLKETLTEKKTHQTEVGNVTSTHGQREIRTQHGGRLPCYRERQKMTTR